MTDQHAEGRSRYRLHGVERALDTLELLAAAGPDGMTLTELAEKIAVSKSSAFALLQTLVARGFVADSGSRLAQARGAQRVICRIQQSPRGQVILDQSAP